MLFGCVTLKVLRNSFIAVDYVFVKNTVSNLAGGVSYYKPCEVKFQERNKSHLTLHLPEILYASLQH